MGNLYIKYLSDSPAMQSKMACLEASGVSLVMNAVHRWVFVCCGNRVQVYSHSSHQIVSSLPHDGTVTATLLNPKNNLQVSTIKFSMRDVAFLNLIVYSS